jgi:hypothetical protein
MENSSVGDFEILELETGTMSIHERRKTVTLKEWDGFFDATTGRLQVTVEEVKERVFHGGLDPNDGVRKIAWLFLLGVYPWDSSLDERQALMNSKRDEYIRLKGAWWERMVEGNSTEEQYEWWKEQRNRIGRSYLRLVTMSLLLIEPNYWDIFSKGCTSYRSHDPSLCRGGYSSSRPRLPICRDRNKCASGTDERHAIDVQRIQS